jgi:DNA helicase-2/ATP-dependent DNA helicase PcrA
VLVDEYQDTNRLQAAILLALKPEAGADRGRRRRASDLRVSRAECATSSTSRSSSTPPARIVTLERNYRSTQPILDASNAVIALAAERFAKALWSDTASASGRSWSPSKTNGRRRGGSRIGCLARREGGIALKPPGGAVPSSPPQRRARAGADRGATFPFVKFGGLQFLEAAHDQGRAVGAALGPEPAQPTGRVSRRRCSCPASDRPTRGGCSMRWAARPILSRR